MLTLRVLKNLLLEEKQNNGGSERSEADRRDP
jgi:hypothetical protein